MNYMATTNVYCPCCGSVMTKPADPKYLTEVTLTQMEKVIINLMVKRHPAGVSLEAMMDHIYGAAANGGPNYAADSVRVTISRLRKKIDTFGWAIAYSLGSYHFKYLR